MPAHGDQHITAAANPFDEVKPRMSEYTAQEIATLQSRLDKQLGPEFISSRPGAAGQKVHYLAAEKCINLANEVFGFNGWSSGIKDIQVDFVEENSTTGKISLGLSVIVRVSLRDGTFHEDIGYGHIENCKGKAAAFEKAKKEGTTDGLKRALRNFGNVLGNCVYDKEYLARITKIKAGPGKWDVENLHRHPDFAPAKKEPSAEAEGSRTSENATVATELLNADEFDTEDFDETDFGVAEADHPDEAELGAAAAQGNADPRGPDGGHKAITLAAARTNAPPPQQPKPLPGQGQQNQQSAATSKPAYHAQPNAPAHAAAGNGLPSHQSNPHLGAVRRFTANQAPNGPQNQAPQIPEHHARNVPPPVPNRNMGRPPTGPQSKQPQSPHPTHRPNGAPNPQLGAASPHQGQNIPGPQFQRNIGGAPGHAAPVQQPQLDPNTADLPAAGFITARAAETVQSGPVAQAPAFNPHAESPSIRKTAGFDHTSSKPVVRPPNAAGPVAAAPAPGAASLQMGQPRGNITNPAADSGRRIGAPPAAGQSPMANRSAYKPPLKRPADGQPQGATRPALNDVTSATINAPAEVPNEPKRQRMTAAPGAAGAPAANG